VRILSTALERGADRVRLSAEFQRGTDRFDVWFEFPAEHADLVADGPEPFAALALLPAMQAHEPLEIVPPLSARQLQGLARVREVWHRWRPDFAAVPIVATPRAGARPPGRHVAAFFSLGVDSFYTALKHRRFGAERLPLDHLVFMRGLERPLESSEGADGTGAVVRSVAAELGVAVVEGATNLRTRFPLDWASEYHGAGLSATALALGGGCGTVLVPATLSWEALIPTGGTPTTDEHYSTERTRVLYDGGEASRAVKLATIASDPLALAHLRVCTANRAGPHNCGRCGKCVRTMAMLAVAGRLRESGSFPHELPRDVGRLLKPHFDGFFREVVAHTPADRVDLALEARLQAALRARARREHFRAWVERTPAAALLPVADALGRGARSATGFAALRARRLVQGAGSRATGTRGSTLHSGSADAQA
jgi:hypothetical protein